MPARDDYSTTTAWSLFAGLVDRRTFLPEVARGQKVVHLGCVDEGLTMDRAGTGDLLHEELSRVASSIVGVDISDEGLRELAALVPGDYVLGDVLELCDLDIPSRCDLVIAAELIEHLSSPGPFLVQLRRYLESSGARGIITTPNAYSWTHWWRFAAFRREWVHPDHVLLYSPATLNKAVQLAGLEISALWIHRWERRGMRQLPVRLADSAILRVNPLLGVGLVVEVRPR